jgi:hypothetical protein
MPLVYLYTFLPISLSMYYNSIALPSLFLLPLPSNSFLLLPSKPTRTHFQTLNLNPIIHLFSPSHSLSPLYYN